jgi:hypothetical protein
MVGEHDRLGPLQVRVPRHRRLHRLGGARQERLLGAAEAGHRLRDRGLHVETLVERDLVVARAPGVELAADLAHELDEPPLHVGVNVLELRAEGERPRGQLLAHRLQTLHQRVGLRRADEPCARERPRPGDAAHDVVRPEPLVEGERAGEAFGGGIGGLGEPPAPRLAHGNSAAMSSMMRWVMRERAVRSCPSASKRRGGPKRTASGWRRGM